MSNPDNALGTNGAYGGRTSVNAFNDVMASFKSRGILSGWACAPSSGLKVTLGGDGTTRDVAIAEDNSGNKTSVNNISQAPVEVTMPAAPANNSRVDSIVAYIESSPSSAGETDNYTAVNLLTVSGSASATPTAPSDSDIRTAITADGASGPTAYYVVLANVTIASGTTDIDASMISAGTSAQLAAKNIDFTEYSTTEKVVGTWIDGKPIYRRVVDSGVKTGSNITYDAFTGATKIISTKGYWINGTNNSQCVFGGTLALDGPIVQTTRALVYPSNNGQVTLQFSQTGGTAPSSVRMIVAVEYTKS